MAYTEEQKREFEVAYQSLLPQFQPAELRLRELVERAVARIDDKRLVRAQVRGSRVKSVDSVRRKAEAQGISPKDGCLSIGDLIGARVVCNTVEDVRRFKELLLLELPSGEFVEEEDHIVYPKSSGYRGLHLKFRVDVEHGYSSLRIPCEVQIRTLLQDSWAELVHSDIYKEGATLPEDLRGRTQDLATVLAGADQIASRIRSRVMQETRIEPEAVRLDTLTKDGLAFVFAEVFGRKPPDYVVQEAYEACLDEGITAVAGLRDKLSDKSFRDAVAKAYRDELRLGFDISAENIFTLTPVAVAKGDKEATKKARRLARAERKEIDTVWRNQVLGELPESWENFLTELEAQSIDVEAVAEALGVASACSVCGTTIVDDYSFLEAVAAHYGADMHYEGDLIRTLLDAADCWADNDYPNLCSYHAYQASKDD